MKTCSTILIIGESTDGQLSTITTQLMNIGKRLARASGKTLCLALLGSSVAESAHKAYGYGADQVVMGVEPLLAHYMPDSYLRGAHQIVQQVDPALVLLGNTDIGMDLAPRLAMCLKTGVVTDCVDIKVDNQGAGFLYIKPVFGGKAHGVLRLHGASPQVVTIREGAFDSQSFDLAHTGEPTVVELKIVPARLRTCFVRKENDENQAMALRLSTSKIVVCAGRGVKNQEGVQLIKKTAELLDGAVAGSRPVVDYGWLPYSLQVGLTGKKVNPQVYIAVGISGAIQHMAGCMKSKVIVAINSDETAPIFMKSHFGAVGDFREILSGLNDELEQFNGGRDAISNSG